MATYREDRGNPVTLYEDESERLRHLNAMQIVAMHAGSPIEEVAKLYEKVLEGFKGSAKIRDFLPILVSKRVKDLLRTKQGS